MGYEYIKRPLRVINSTSIIPSVDLSGNLSLTGSGAAFNLAASTLTATTAVQTLAASPLTILTQGSSAAAHQVNISAPLERGEVRYIVVDPTSSPEKLFIQLASSGLTFFGTTYNGVTFDAAADDAQPNTCSHMLMLIAASTTQWACSVLSASTNGWLFSNTTGSTNA